MNLRNKKTGESGYYLHTHRDYEEPKEYWSIDCFSPDGLISEFTKTSSDILENRKSIGNYFNTREEAEIAVEKLKAIKRLKDKGIKFDLDFVKNNIKFVYRINGTLYSSVEEERIIFNDMKLLFGGEE